MPHLSSISFFGDALVTSARAARITAANIANADTPGYKARGLDFQHALEARLQGNEPVQAQYAHGLPMGLDGNNVSLDYESLQAAESATRIRESLTFLKNSTQSLITALRPESSHSGG
jgi:flagellar basal-body rod protein FlgB